MADFFTYHRKRREMGKPCNFQDAEIRHCGYFPTYVKPGTYTYLERNPNFIDLDNIAEYSEHSVSYFLNFLINIILSFMILNSLGQYRKSLDFR